MNTTIGSPTTNYVRISAAKNYQMIDGFGFALTGGSCYNLMRMSAEERATLLTKIFSESRGYGASYVRISIGCSDFSRSRYTLCDTKGIEHSVTVEKLGLDSEIREKTGRDPAEWAKERAQYLTQKEKQEQEKISIEFSPTKLISKNHRYSFNVGYLFLQKIYRLNFV